MGKLDIVLEIMEMKKKYLDYTRFAKLDLVFDEKKFLDLKKSMIDEYGLFNICEFKLKQNDANDQKLYELLENAKKSTIGFLANVGNQVFAQTGNEEAKSLPYPPMLPKTIELPREEIFNLALNSIKKTNFSIVNNLDGYLCYPENLARRKKLGTVEPYTPGITRYPKPLKDGEVSIPANLWLKEASNAIMAKKCILEYFNPFNYKSDTLNEMDK